MNRYRIYANICMGDDLYRYRSFVVHADDAKSARAQLSNDWNIDRVVKMRRSEVA
jgi:hypothetical protein